MGLLGTLGKIGKAGFNAATGNWGGLIQDVGGMLGQGASSARQGRMDEAQTMAQINNANNNAALNAARFNVGVGAERMGQVGRADLVSRMQDAPLTGDPRIDKFAGGGLRPSAFGEDTRNAANEQKRQALLALMNQTDRVTPQMTTMRKAGMLEKIGGVAGLAGGLTGAVRGNFGGGRTMTMADINPSSMDDYFRRQGRDTTPLEEMV